MTHSYKLCICGRQFGGWWNRIALYTSVCFDLCIMYERVTFQNYSERVCVYVCIRDKKCISILFPHVPYKRILFQHLILKFESKEYKQLLQQNWERANKQLNINLRYTFWILKHILLLIEKIFVVHSNVRFSCRGNLISHYFGGSVCIAFGQYKIHNIKFIEVNRRDL